MFSAPSLAQQVMGIAAVVNDQMISRSDLDNRLELILSSTRVNDPVEARRRMTSSVLRTLIDEKVMEQAAKGAGIEVDSDSLQRGIADLEQRNQMPNNTLLSSLEKAGIDPETLKDKIRAEMAWRNLVMAKARSIEISDEEVAEAIAQEERDKNLPEQRVGEIFLPVDSPDEESDVRELANRLFDQLKNGTPFPPLARQFSKSVSAANDGDMGWVKVGRLAKEVEEVLAKMEPGQLAKPIRTDEAYVIVFLIQRRPAPAQIDQEARVSLHQVFVPLPDGATIEEAQSQTELARTISSTARNCADMAAFGKDVGSEMSGSMGLVKLSQLPEDLRARIEPLQINQATQPMRQPGGISVIMVCDRIEPKQELDSVRRQRIQNELFNEKADLMARRLMRDLRRDAFVDIRL